MTWLIVVGVWALLALLALVTLPVRMDRERLRNRVRLLERERDTLHGHLGLVVAIATGQAGWRLLEPEHMAGQAVQDLRARITALQSAIQEAPPTVRAQIHARLQQIEGIQRVGRAV